MATKSSLRFTIRAGGQPRTLFSVAEKKDGTLILPLKSAPLFRLPGLGAPAARAMPGLKSQKYSIHPSADSRRQINYIHHTMELASGHKVHSHHVTRAIKGGQAFAFIFCRRSHDIRSPLYVADGKTEQVSLGSYDPDAFTLIYAVIAGAPNAQFGLEGAKGGSAISCQPAEINITHRQFSRARLTVIWTFLALPSHLSSLTYHRSTTKPDDKSNEPDLDEGWLADRCVGHFQNECLVLEDELRGFVIRERADLVPGQPIVVPIRGRYFKDGTTPNPAALEYLKELQKRILTL